MRSIQRDRNQGLSPPGLGMHRRSALATLGALSLLPFSRSYAEETAEIDLWEVSTRHLPCGPCCTTACNSYEFYRGGMCGVPWEVSSWDALLEATQADANKLTLFYAHGNWMTRDNTRERARFIAEQIQRRCYNHFRIIFLSWPSQRERGPVRDIRENAECADSQAFYLARLLRSLPHLSQVSLLGFSLGARVVTGALHLDSGGTVDGQAIDTSETIARQPYRVSLAAPAVDRSWLQPCGRFGLAMQHVERLVNLYNSKDPVLRRFRFIDNAITRPIAAGFAGFVGVSSIADPGLNEPLANQDRVQQFDCSSALGSTHDERSYYTRCSCFTNAVHNVMRQQAG